MAEENPISEIPPTAAKKRNPASSCRTRRRGIQRLVAWLVFILLRALAATLRFTWDDRSEIINHPPTGPAIFCIWHNRLAMCMEAYSHFWKNPPQPRPRRARQREQGRRVARGDSGKFQRAARARLVQPARSAGVARTDDLGGARLRPRHHARRPARPVLRRARRRDGHRATDWPCPSFRFRSTRHWKIRLKSWDRFQIPLPFSRCEMNAAKPIFVPRECHRCRARRIAKTA